jgi:hypothetical protein
VINAWDHVARANFGFAIRLMSAVVIDLLRRDGKVKRSW